MLFFVIVVLSNVEAVFSIINLLMCFKRKNNELLCVSEIATKLT